MFSFCHVQDLTVFLEGMHLRMLLWVLLIPSTESVTFQHLVFIVNTGCCQSAIKQQYFRNKTELVWTLFVEVRTVVRLFCEDLSEVKKAVQPTGQHWRQLPSHWKVHIFTFSHVELPQRPKWSGLFYFWIFLLHQLKWVLETFPFCQL